MFAVLVHFEIHPDHFERFRAAMLENARASKADEPGCHRFDVAFDATTPYSVMLYELYTDAAAFEAHKATPHFAEFEAVTSEMVGSKSVETWEEVHS